MEELKKRQKYHEDKAAKHRLETEKLIADGNAEEASVSSEKETSCEKLALDYGHQAEELGKQTRELREEYDNRREEHSQLADELALLDTEARRMGKLVPAGRDDPDLAKQVRVLKRCFLGLLGCIVLALAAWIIWPTVTRIEPQAVAPAVKPPAAALRQDGLVLCYTFATDEGAKVFDQSGLGNNGIVHGAKWTPAGRVGGAYEFDGVKDYIDTTYVQENVTSYSISLWVKTTTTEGDQVMVQNRAMNSDDVSGGSLTLSIGKAAYGLTGDTGRFGFWEDAPGLHGKYTTQAFNDGKWHQVVGTWTGNGAVEPSQFNIFVDGEPASSTSFSAGIAPRSPLTGKGTTKIGYHQAWSSFFCGTIDEVMIFRRALSADEVKQMYKKVAAIKPPAETPVAGKRAAVAEVSSVQKYVPAGKMAAGRDVVPRDGLVLYLPFDADEGSNTKDLSGMDNHGKVYGVTWTTNGASGGAYDFNGVGSYISVPDSDSLHATEVTLCAWIYVPELPRFDSMIMEKRPHDGCWELDLLMYGMILVRGGSAQGVFTDDIVIFNSQWCHVGVTIDSAGNAKTYVNGVLQKSGSLTPIPRTTGDVVIGMGRPSDNYFKGIIDEVRIYNRVLSANEMSKFVGASR